MTRLAACRSANQRRTSTTMTCSAAPTPRDGAPPARLGKVLIAPAFYTDVSAFRPLAAELRARGYDAALAPIRWYHWTPTLGGRSQRPILDRLDWALEDLCRAPSSGSSGGATQRAPAAAAAPMAVVDPHTLELPSRAPYGFWEFLQEMRDPSLGARPLRPASPLPDPAQLTGRAAIVASSAAGWICRVLVAGDRAPPYGGRSYEGAARRARALVTLGTPHYSSEPVTRLNIDWVNRHAPGAFRSPEIKYVAVGSGGVAGKELIPGSNLGDFAWESYKLCAGDGKVDGDGVTPLECALALEGAERVRLEGCAHNPPLFGGARGGKKKGGGAEWYGEGAFLEAWVKFLALPSDDE